MRVRYVTTALGFPSNERATRGVVPLVQAPKAQTRASSKPLVCLCKQADIPGAHWRPLRIWRRPRILSRGSSLVVTYSPNVVGTANRAGIRRLQQLEADNAPPPTGERQQRQPHEGFVERDRTIRQLNELLSTPARDRSERPSVHERLLRRQLTSRRRADVARY